MLAMIKFNYMPSKSGAAHVCKFVAYQKNTSLGNTTGGIMFQVNETVDLHRASC